jgi:hypothetical protein
MFEIIGCVDNAPDVLGRQYGGKVANFSGKRKINADFLLGYVFVKES